MENNQKRSLLNLSYYTLIILGIITSVLFAIRVASTAIPALIQVVYYVWTAVLVITLIFDVICTRNGGRKYISGMIFYILFVLCAIVPMVIFFTQGLTFAGITLAETNYFINIVLSFIPIILGIYAFIFGERIINFND